MKRLLLFVSFAILLVFPATASASHDWHDRQQPYDRGDHWNHRPSDHSRHWEQSMPFKWHDRRVFFAERHHMEAIHDRDWDRRFPGLRAYRWQGHGEYNRGFWHHGHYIRDAVLFFDRDDELVSFGYMADGVFVYVREDNEWYENDDSFFFSWWNRHGGIFFGRR